MKVDLIIADNAENQKLDFEALANTGASVLRIKNVGYGIMHQKFCVIDRKIAMHGTYNWTNNAKNNNHESIIITDHQGTIESLVTTFFDIKQRAIAILEGKEVEAVDNTDSKFPENYLPAKLNGNAKQEKDSGEEYIKVLDAMIAAETSSFDRRALKQEGYDRARATNGDSQVLSTALDSVYSIFVNDIDVAEEKKKRLITKVEELQLTTLTGFQDAMNLQLLTLENEIAVTESTLKLKISNLKTSEDLDQKEIEGIKQITILGNASKISSLRDEINKREKEFIKPTIKLYEMIPVCIFGLGLIVYLFLFYSSAAYILLFAEGDALEARMNGAIVNPPEVFSPYALSFVLDKGMSAVVYVFLFFIIPLALASIKLFTDNRYLQYGMTLLAVVVVDFFIALKVAFAINGIDYLSGRVN